MKVFCEVSIARFKAWGGAEDVIEILKDKGLCEEFDNFIEEAYPSGIEETALNDILWHQDVGELLGVNLDDEESEEV